MEATAWAAEVEETPWAADVEAMAGAAEVEETPWAADVEETPWAADVEAMAGAAEVEEMPWAADVEATARAADVEAMVRAAEAEAARMLNSGGARGPLRVTAWPEVSTGRESAKGRRGSCSRALAGGSGSAAVCCALGPGIPWHTVSTMLLLHLLWCLMKGNIMILIMSMFLPSSMHILHIA